MSTFPPAVSIIVTPEIKAVAKHFDICADGEEVDIPIWALPEILRRMKIPTPPPSDVQKFLDH